MAQVVVITGATAGVGRATARAFARRKACIGLLARGVDRLTATAAEVEGAGGRALALPTDVADAEAVERAAEAVERQLGPIDIWINCAMATTFAPLHEIDADEYRRATEVTYLGFVYGTMAALRRMRPRNHGIIVQVGSALAYRSIPLQAPYCGAKHAILGFTASLRSELMHEGSGVHVTMVQMPALNTPQFEWARNKMPRRPQPVPPIFEPEMAAEAIVFATQTRRREIFVGGSTVAAIIANRLVPGLLDRYLARSAYRGQMTEEANPGGPGNLFAPAAGDRGARGRFGAQAHRKSTEFWAVRHRGLLAAGFVAFVAALLTAWPSRVAARAARRRGALGQRPIDAVQD